MALILAILTKIVSTKFICVVKARGFGPYRESNMDDLQYLHYQLQLLEREREEFLADGSVLPEVQPQSKDCNQTSMGETK